jgi:hypothetical protein
MSDRKTMTEVLRDARAKALFKLHYNVLTPAQKFQVDELMRRSHKYARKEADERMARSHKYEKVERL